MINVRLLAKIYIINQEGNLLLLMRSTKVAHRPSGWDLPGGNVEAGEDPNIAVLRELNEEAGIYLVDSSKIIYVASQNDPQHTITLLYQAFVYDPEIKLSHEHQQYIWINPSEITKYDIPEKYKKGALAISL